MMALIRHRKVVLPFYELFTGPAKQILDRYFESEILKATLATDAVIGAMVSPRQNGSAYVLLHHVMGEAAGKKGVWAYVEGGMGSGKALSMSTFHSIPFHSIPFHSIPFAGSLPYTYHSLRYALPSISFAVSEAIASVASQHGAEICTNTEVAEIIVESSAAVGIRLRDGSTRFAGRIVSNLTPYRTFLEMLGSGHGLSEDYLGHIRHTGGCLLSLIYKR
jgi:phytoene dehydrogenase-like protein